MTKWYIPLEYKAGSRFENIIHHIIKLKEKNHLIISIDMKKKAFDKIQHPPLMKILRKIGTDRNVSI